MPSAARKEKTATGSSFRIQKAKRKTNVTSSSESTSRLSGLTTPVACTAGCLILFFFFNDTATTEIYTLSLHDALPISVSIARAGSSITGPTSVDSRPGSRSEEHTSELQSRSDLVCRLLLEKKKQT